MEASARTVGKKRLAFRRFQAVLALLAAAGVVSCDSADAPMGPELWMGRPASIQITGDRHWTDWSEYASGVQPVGFTQAWDPTPHFRVVDDTVGGGKVLEWFADGEQRNRFGLAYDGYGNAGDQQVYTEFRVRSLGGGTSEWFMGSAAVRMTGTAGDEGGYALWFVGTSISRWVSLATWTSGMYTPLGDLALPWSFDAWYSIRLEAIGSTIRAKVWPRGTAEPAAWGITATDTRWPTGKPGVSHHDNGRVQWDYWEATATAPPPPPPPPPPPAAMTVYSGFANGTAGTAPVGWTETSAPSSSGWALADVPSALDGRVLRNTTTATGRHILRLDTVSSSTEVQEVLVRMRMSAGNGRGPGIALRHTMNGTLESAYVAYLRPNSDEVEVNRFLAGGWQFVGAASFVNDPGAWYWMRFRAEGTSLRVKVWNDGAAEPAAWTANLSDAGLASGAVGLYVYEPNTVDYDLIGFAGGGGTAPGAVVPPPPTLTQLVLTPTSAAAAPGGSVQFHAYGVLTNGDTATVPVTYTATGGVVAATGTYTAGAGVGTFQVIATHAGAPVLADTATVTIAAAPPVTTSFGTDFGGDALGVQPPGWTETSQAANSSWTVVADATTQSGRILRNVTTVTGRHILRLDAAPDTTGTQEVLVRMRLGDDDNRGPGIALRHTMNGSLESAYVAYLRPSLDQIEVNRFLNGGWQFIGAVPFTNDPGSWYWIRFRAEGTTLRVKAWSDGAAEPAAWTHQMVDGGLAAGSVGLYTYEPNTVDYAVFGYASGGGTAPGAVVPPPPTLTGIVLTPATATLAPGATRQFQAVGSWSDGTTSAVPVSYSATGGSISGSGLYTAGATDGAFRVIATHAGAPALADTSAITIATPPAPPPPITSFSTSFGTDPLNIQPAGWTETSQPDNSAWTVVADASVPSGRVLRNVTTSTQRHILQLDRTATAATQEVLVRVRLADSDSRGPGIALRHSMNGNLESAYVAYLRPAAGLVEINRFQNGGWLYVGATAFASAPGQWYWMRFRAEGGSLRVKVWSDGTPEPAAWTIQASDTGLASGSVGVYVYEPNTVDFDFFVFEAGGATATAPPGS